MKVASNSKTRQCAQAKELEPGMEIEFFRQPANKDTQGWRGPAELVKMDSDGTCHIKWQGTTFTCRLQDVRRALTYLYIVYLTFLKTSDSTHPWDILMDHITHMITGTQQTIAIINMQGKAIMSNTAKRNHNLLQAILHVAAKDLQLKDCVGARIAHGIQHLGPIKHVDWSLLTWWPHDRPDDIHYSHQPASQHIDCRKLHRNATPQQLCICQYLCSNPEDTAMIQRTFPDIPNIGQQPPLVATPHPSMEGLIPTVPPWQPPHDAQPPQPPQQQATAIIQSAAQTARKRSRSLDSAASGNPAPHCSPCLEPDDEFETPGQSSQPPQPPTNPQDVPVPEDPELDDMSDSDGQLYVEPDLTFYSPPLQLTLDHINATAPLTPQDIWYLDDGFTPDASHFDTDTCEIELSPTMAYLSGFCDHELAEDEILVLIANKREVKGVINRNCDNLTKEDIINNRKEVEAAQLDELRRWYDLQAFKRVKRATATNIVDGTWVMKWKMVKGTDGSGKEAWRRIVKARLTARGFRDLQAYQENVETFSGTATKSAQRMVCNVTAQHGFTLFSMDISAAFLKGLTFKEIAELTGKPLRAVQFHVPKDSVHLLRQLPGLHDFDPVTEVLEFLKAIWGLKDAPRAFGMRRDQTLRAFGATPTVKDPHLWVKRTTDNNSTRLECILSTHLDDIKGGSHDEQRSLLAKTLKATFGDDLKTEIGTFEFTGVKHIQSPDKSIHCHQDHYVQELSAIPLENTAHINDDDPAPTPETEAFGSLLGGLGWLLVTRADICAFVSFLQRLARKPLIRHLKMINQVLRYCKRTPAGIAYRKLVGIPYLLCIADSAYQANADKTDCVALRGYFVFIACRSADNTTHTLGGPVQLVDFLSKKLSVISRSAFAAELRNVLEAAQDTINHAVMQHDIYRGPFTAEQCAAIRDSATYFMEIVIATDNQGLYNALTKEDPTPGSDGSMAFHIKALRQLLDDHHITSVAWLDNRDMIADGLTKGKPSRDDINSVLSTGHWQPEQEYKIWTSANKRSDYDHD